MFDYSVRALHMSEAEAVLRIRAARLVREFPEALGMVARGELNLTALRLLSPVLKREHAELLSMARRKSKFEVQELIAKYFPKPDVESSIRRLPQPVSEQRLTSEAAQLECTLRPANAEHQPVESSTRDSVVVLEQGSQPSASNNREAIAHAAASRGAEASTSECVRPSAVASAFTLSLRSDAPLKESGRVSAAGWPHVRARVSAANVPIPLSEGRYKIQFTAGKEFCDKLEQAEQLLRNQVSRGDWEVVFGRALELLIAERKKQMFGVTNRSRSNRSGLPTGARPATARAASSNVTSVMPADVSAEANATQVGELLAKLEHASATRANATPVRMVDVSSAPANTGLVKAEHASADHASAATANASVSAVRVNSAPANAEFANATSAIPLDANSAPPANAEFANATSAIPSDANSAPPANAEFTNATSAIPSDANSAPPANAEFTNATSAIPPDANSAPANATLADTTPADATSTRRMESNTPSRSRYVPRELRRQVYARDEGRCCFISHHGERCPSRALLEFHHIVPYALGGDMTLENIQLRCRAHNVLEAERDYGRDHLKQQIQRSRSQRQRQQVPQTR
jgi:hypothetical protein